MKTIRIGTVAVPAIGQGTWKMGADPAHRTEEIDAIRYGLGCGLTLIDTAEMYADGGSERVVGEAIHDVRESVFLVSKVWPSHMTRDGIMRALEESLKRLRTPYLDLYLLHWPSQEHPLTGALKGLADAHGQGLIRHAGISNFPTKELKDAQALMPAGTTIDADQVEYHLLNRRAEHALLPYAAQEGIAVMAYSPVKMLTSLTQEDPRRVLLEALAETHQTTMAAIALAYLIQAGPVVAIPKAVTKTHIDANRQALDVALTVDDVAAIQQAFPAQGEELPFQAL